MMASCSGRWETVSERTSRRVRRYWLVSLAIAAVASIVVFVLARSDLSRGATDTFVSRIIGAVFVAGIPGAVVLMFAAIISIQVCSKKFVAAQLAVILRGLWLNAAVLPLFGLILGATSALGMAVWRGIWVWVTKRR